METLRQKKQRLSSTAGRRELIGEAVTLLEGAKQVHDQLESYTKEATDWEMVNETTLWVLAEFTRIAEEAALG